MTRRRLVLAGGAAGPRSTSAALSARARRRATRWPTGRRVPARVRTEAHARVLRGDGQRQDGVTLRLTAVTDLVRARTEPSLRGRDDAFALTFSGASARRSRSGIRRLHHPTLG